MGMGIPALLFGQTVGKNVTGNLYPRSNIPKTSIKINLDRMPKTGWLFKHCKEL
jgi:hypothetical protein